MKLEARLLAVPQLSGAQREEMFALMDAYYENVDHHQFGRDLDEKRWVIWVQDRDTQTLRGFSTQMLLETEVAGKPITALFSGDTIIDRECWGEQALTHVWGRLALALMDRHPTLYWFLISKGYKTYRFLPVFFHEYYPRPQTPTPAWVREILDVLGRLKFPQSYDPVGGIVKPSEGKDRLREGVAEVSQRRLKDAHVCFFVECNPKHHLGAELCCLAPLSRANFTAAAYRVIGSPPEPLEPLP